MSVSQFNFQSEVNHDSTDFHSYYETSMTNNDTTGSQPVVLKLNEQRSGHPLILNPSDYFFTIARFQVQTETLPLFIPQPDRSTANINTLIYRFGITDGTTADNQLPITFIPPDLSIPPPAYPIARF